MEWTVHGFGKLRTILPRVKGTRGQVMVEYVIALVVILSLTSLLTLMLYAIRQNGDRVLNLVASEYP